MKMVFECKMNIGKKLEIWHGSIEHIINYGSHFEIFIVSRSSIFVVVEKTSRGGFACIPDFGAGCHLVKLEDFFWNTEQLVEKLGKVDGITVSTALKYLSKKYILF
jgi:hypothetical protein